MFRTVNINAVLLALHHGGTRSVKLRNLIGISLVNLNLSHASWLDVSWHSSIDPLAVRLLPLSKQIINTHSIHRIVVRYYVFGFGVLPSISLRRLSIRIGTKIANTSLGARLLGNLLLRRSRSRFFSSWICLINTFLGWLLDTLHILGVRSGWGCDFIGVLNLGIAGYAGLQGWCLIRPLNMLNRWFHWFMNIILRQYFNLSLLETGWVVRWLDRIVFVVVIGCRNLLVVFLASSFGWGGGADSGGHVCQVALMG